MPQEIQSTNFCDSCDCAESFNMQGYTTFYYLSATLRASRVWSAFFGDHDIRSHANVAELSYMLFPKKGKWEDAQKQNLVFLC